MKKEMFRKMSKSAAAYLVGGIAFIQLAPVFFDTFPPESLFGLSADRLMQYLFALVAIGFPIVLLIAYLSSKNAEDDRKTEKKKVTATGGAIVNENQVVTTPGDAVVTPETDIEVEEEPARAFVFDPGVSLSTIVDTINAVGAGASDLVAILEALRESGALRAELIVI